MSYRKQIIFLILSVLVCITLIISIFVQIKTSAVREMNERQMIYARLAAKGIESFLNQHIAILQVLSRSQRIILMNEEGKALLRSEQKTADKFVKGVTRLNARGEIIFTFPSVLGATGTNISGQEHVREVLSTHQLVVSDIFMTVQGFNSVAIHVPVYRAGAFDGTVGFLISFEALAKDYLDNLYIPKDRYAMLVNARGKIIHCITPDHAGHSLAEFYQDHSEAAVMIDGMMKGKEGAATFIDRHFASVAGEAQQMHAVHAPIRAGGGYWSVAVVSSEQLILPATRSTRLQIIILALFLVLFFAVTVYVVARIRGAGIEAQKRQKIEEDLIKSAEEIRDLYHNAPCGYHSLDASGNIVHINDMELSWLGYTREELIGKPYSLVLSEANHDRFNRAFSELKQQGLIRDVEYEITRKDGTAFPALVTASVVTDPQGNFIMSRSMVMDMTLRRAQEEQLRESEELYRTALESTSDGVTIVQNGKYVYASQRLLDTIGQPDIQLIGKAQGAFVHPDDWAKLTETYRQRSKGDPIPTGYELRVVKPDQSIVYLLVSAVIVIYHAKPAILSFMRDVTKQRETEDALRESEELYRTALESTSDGITIADVKDGKYLYVNQKLMATLGRPRENIIDGPIDIFVHPEDAGLGKKYFLERKGSGRKVSHFESRILKPDGSVALFSVTALDIIFQGKKAVVSFCQDVTEAKQKEQALSESEALYRTAMESTSDGVTILQDGKYVYVNQKFLETLGITRSDIIDRPLGVLAGPEAQQGLKDFLNRHPQDTSGPDMHITRVLKPGGSYIYLQSSSVDIIYRGKSSILTFIKDITERKNAEQALRESEALYRTALETTSDGISIIDLRTGNYLYANQRFMDTIGRPAENLIGRPLDIYVHPEDVDVGRKKYLSKRADDKDRIYYETRAIKPDGTIVMLGVTATETIYQGKAAVISFISNITERKHTEEALRESEELYRTAMEQTNDGISVVQDGKYAYVNQKFLQAIGRTEAEVVNHPLGIYIHPDDCNRVKQYFVARIHGEEAPASYDIRVLKPDGFYIMMNIKAAKIIYNRKPATISFITDVTEQKRAEEALRQSEERYRTIFESIDDDYFETDLRGIFTFLNKPVSWTGLRREDLVGSNFGLYVSPEMNKKIHFAFNKIYREGKSSRITDCDIVRQDGSAGHLEMSVSLMRNGEGNPVGFRGITRDVSDRFKMETEREKLTEQLHQAQKMEAIGTLAGGIAHDFNNLLMGIQGYTSLMMLEVQPTHGHYEQLRAVQTLVQSGANLTRQLLGFARAGRYEVVSTNLNDLISKSIALFARTKKEIRIFEKYAEKIWTVEVDRGQMEQVLLNMFVNAWQAMPGGGSLYLETANVILDDTPAKIHDLKPGRHVKISITDTGIGMDEKTQQRIFDPFFTTKEMGRGTGLGLASAYGIAKGHSGMITVYSEKGHGTTFNIYLPASSRTVDSEDTVETEPASGRETILLVDDEEVITNVTCRLLKELGYSVIVANNGEEAINIYTERHADIDLVILDMIMPGISGGDTFDRLKAVNSSVRAILSSGYSINGNAQAIMKKGVRVFLQKPYRLHDLAQKIRQALAD